PYLREFDDLVGEVLPVPARFDARHEVQIEHGGAVDAGDELSIDLRGGGVLPRAMHGSVQSRVRVRERTEAVIDAEEPLSQHLEIGVELAAGDVEQLRAQEVDEVRQRL